MGSGTAGAGGTSGTPGVEAVGVTKRFGAAPVLRGVSVVAPEGGVLALLGPSGCGKTTLLRIVAGLEIPDAGEVRVRGQVLSGPGVFVAPERRRVGMVFQDWALFPHLTVEQNVGYGLPRGEARRSQVGEALELVGLSALGGRLPGTLSGGQQQRVALARALAPRPSALLLDEPFSNLDARLRTQVRSEVHRLLAELEITTVFVTHDQDEAFVLGHEVAVMSEGAVVQQSSPEALYTRPASPWVASFVGDANLVPGEAGGSSAGTPLGPVPLAEPVAGAVQVLVRPEELSLAAGDGATVEVVEFYGHDSVYRVRLDHGLRLRVRATSAPLFRAGDRVSVAYGGRPTVAFPPGAPDLAPV